MSDHGDQPPHDGTSGNRRILITGAGGQLAAAIAAEYSGRADLHALSRAELDITEWVQVRDHVERFRPDVIINCAAYNYVDRAEDEPEPALNVNAFGVQVLARAATD